MRKTAQQVIEETLGDETVRRCDLAQTIIDDLAKQGFRIIRHRIIPDDAPSQS